LRLRPGELIHVWAQCRPTWTVSATLPPAWMCCFIFRRTNRLEQLCRCQQVDRFGKHGSDQCRTLARVLKLCRRQADEIHRTFTTGGIPVLSKANGTAHEFNLLKR